MKKEDNSISINNITQNAEGGGAFLFAGDAESNLDVFNYSGIVVKIKTLPQEYILQLKTQENRISPAIALEKFKQGDEVSIPTIREDKKIICGYRILNEVDYLYLHELRKE